MKPQTKRIPVRIDKKLAERFAKICEKQDFSMNCVFEKYAQRTVREGRIATEEWAY